jgi:hypothetical protein
MFTVRPFLRRPIMLSLKKIIQKQKLSDTGNTDGRRGGRNVSEISQEKELARD